MFELSLYLCKHNKWQANKKQQQLDIETEIVFVIKKTAAFRHQVDIRLANEHFIIINNVDHSMYLSVTVIITHDMAMTTSNMKILENADYAIIMEKLSKQ